MSKQQILCVKNESPPERCEICHQSDIFDPEANFCQRCGRNIQQSVEKEALLSKLKKYQEDNEKEVRQSKKVRQKEKLKLRTEHLRKQKQVLAERYLKIKEPQFKALTDAEQALLTSIITRQVVAWRLPFLPILLTLTGSMSWFFFWCCKYCGNLIAMLPGNVTLLSFFAGVGLTLVVLLALALTIVIWPIAWGFILSYHWEMLRFLYLRLRLRNHT